MNLKSVVDSSNFSRFFSIWDSIIKDTVESLGKEKAYHIMSFHANTWIDVNSWITSSYSNSKKLNILYAEYQRLLKEIHWLQFIFLASNYPMIYRCQRWALPLRPPSGLHWIHCKLFRNVAGTRIAMGDHPCNTYCVFFHRADSPGGPNT